MEWMIKKGLMVILCLGLVLSWGLKAKAETFSLSSERDKEEITIGAPAIASDATISGKIAESDGITPIQGVTVQTWQDGKIKGIATTDADGIYTISDLLSGTFTVTARKLNYRIEKKPVVLSPGEEAHLDFELVSGQGPLVDHFPLAIGNLWEYSRKISIDNDTWIYPLTCQITGTATISGKESYIMRKEEIEDEDHLVQNDYLAEAEGEFRKYAYEHVEGNVPGPYYAPKKSKGHYYIYQGERFNSVKEIMAS